VLNAAKELGFEPILAVNRDFKAEHDSKTPWKIIPAYEHGFWPEPETDHSSWMTAVRRAAFNLRVKLVYSRIGLLRATLVHLRSSQSTEESIRQTDHAHLTGGLLIMQFLFTYPHLVLKSLWQFVREVFSFIPSGFYQYVGNVWSAFINVWRQIGYPLKAFKLIKSLRSKSRRSGRIKAFERDTRHLFTSLCSVDDGDLVFVPTLSEQDMLGLGRFLKHNQNARSASWHLLFRRNLLSAPASGRGDTGDNHRLLDARSSFESFMTQLNWD